MHDRAKHKLPHLAWSIVKIACKMAMIHGKSEDFLNFFSLFLGILKMILGKKKNTDTRPHKLHAYVEEERRKGERDKRKKRKGAKERHLPGDESELDRCTATWKSERWDQNEVYYEK
jgi:hypothetical protein